MLHSLVDSARYFFVVRHSRFFPLYVRIFAEKEYLCREKSDGTVFAY